MFFLVYCKGATYKFASDRFHLSFTHNRFYVFDLEIVSDHPLLDIPASEVVSVRVKNTFSLRDKEVL